MEKDDDGRKLKKNKKKQKRKTWFSAWPMVSADVGWT